MRLLKPLIFLGVTCIGVLSARAQVPVAKPLKIAVFAPLYLDSVFAPDNSYRPGNGNLPRYMVPGLDFYNGVMLAVDSLNKEHLPISVQVYDTKSTSTPIGTLSDSLDFQDIALIIGAFNSRSDTKTIADIALEKNIPLISATYPNDAGITENPFFVLINPTLRTHIEAIYRFLHRTYPMDNITYFKKRGDTEDAIQYILFDMNKKTAGVPLKLNTVELNDSFAVSDVMGKLDSTKQNIIICGTLNESFGLSLSRVLAANKNYRTLTIGMPTWDNIRDISKDIEIIYTTPYNFIRNEKLNADLSAKYRIRFSGRPNDMFFKGYESMFHFSKLLVKNGVNLVHTLSDKDYKLFNDFDIQPVKSKETQATDYLENKKIYFIRKVDGQVKSIN